MMISFSSKELRSQCQNEVYAALFFSKSVVHSIVRRFSQIRASENAANIPFGNPQCVDDKLIINLAEDHFFEFKIAHFKKPTSPDGLVDWRKVYRVRLNRIGKNNANL